MEACILIRGPIYAGICIITVALLRNRIDCASDIARQYNRVFKIISICCQILFPNNNNIICLCLRNPTSPYFCLVCQGLVKVIRSSSRSLISLFFTCKPSTKGISIPNHIFIVWSGRFISRINELRCIIGCSGTIFMEDKPMACRCIYAECHITGNRDFFVILISITLCIANDMTGTFFDLPTFKMIVLILNGISHIHFVNLLSRGSICPECYFFLTKRNIVLIQVGDSIILEQHRIVDYFFSVCFRRQFFCNSSANVRNRQGSSFYGIILICCPTTEIYSFSQSTCTWII